MSATTKHNAQCENCKLKRLFVAAALLALHKKLGYQASGRQASPSLRLIATTTLESSPSLAFRLSLCFVAVVLACCCYQFYLVAAFRNWNSLEFIKCICIPLPLSLSRDFA